MMAAHAAQSIRYVAGRKYIEHRYQSKRILPDYLPLIILMHIHLRLVEKPRQQTNYREYGYSHCRRWNRRPGRWSCSTQGGSQSDGGHLPRIQESLIDKTAQFLTCR
jgi:hypothetical protein